MDQHHDRPPVKPPAEWPDLPGGDTPLDPRETFRQVSNIAVCMSYDLIDKLRFYEKETLKLTPPEIEQRLPHMKEFLERLKVAYLQFSDVDF